MNHICPCCQANCSVYKTASLSTTHLPRLNLVTFSGGSGFRNINISLARRQQFITRVVPVCDNGGSSRILRDFFQVMPIGDIRQALMTQAHGEGRVGAVVKLFNWRLPQTTKADLLRRELSRFVNAAHPLMQEIEQSLRHVIVNYLQQFFAQLDTSFDLSYGSIGNFVLMGAYLAHNRDINTAIFVFRQLCSIQGNVWPTTLHNELHLHALLADNTLIQGQSRITRLDRAQQTSPVDKIYFANVASNKALDTKQVNANPMVLDALEQADMIVYGPGSFFTSVMPHIMITNIVNTIQKNNIPKVFIANMLHDSESFGYTLAHLIDIFVHTANHILGQHLPARRYITHILVNRNYANELYQRNHQPYLPAGNLDQLQNQGVEIIREDMESPWRRGLHDEDHISDLLIRLGSNNQRTQLIKLQ